MNYLALLAKTWLIIWSLTTPIEARAFYSGPPSDLYYIAQCESGGTQYDDTGHVLISRTHDVGIYQINLSHKEEALKMGYDIMTPEGNTAYAIYLYQQEGTRPWRSSEHCWLPKSTGSEKS